MSARLARLALALYPLAYRRRYGEEMEALLEDQGASPRAIADLLRGAAAAHLHPEPGLDRELGPDDRLKLGLSSTLLCWVVFSLVGLTLYKTTEGGGFTGPGGGDGLLGAARLAIQAMAILGTVAVVLGAAPLVVAALRQARRRGPTRESVRGAGALAVGCVAVFGASTAALVLVAQAGAAPAEGVDAVILALWTGLALACGIGCAVAARRGLFAITVPPGVLHFSRACAVVAVLAMAGIAVATAVYLLALVRDASGLAAEANGPLGLLSVGASLGVQLALMIAVAGVSGSRLRAGTRAR